MTSKESSTHRELLSLTPLRYTDHLIALGIAAVYVVWLCLTSRSVGIPRDESIYFYAADRLSQWFTTLSDSGLAAFSEDSIKAGFSFNHEHPMLMKSLFGLSHHYLHAKWSLISDPILAYRLPTILFAGGLVYLTTLLGTAIGGLFVGGVSALLVMGMPRLFFHAHLSCFDLPVSTMWLSISLAYLGALHRRRWVVGAGVILGLGLATKLNTFFAPFTLLGLSLYHLLQQKSGAETRVWWMRRYLWIGVSMTILGLLVFWAHWPWLYHHTWPRLLEYIHFHARHVHYPVDYLGHLYYGPPFPIHFPFVFTLFTLPVAMLFLGAIGTVYVLILSWWRWRRRDDSIPIELFLIVNMMVPILIIAWPTTPIFGGTKHWMPAMPFLAVIGALALKVILELTRLYKRAGMRVVITLGLVLPGLWLTQEYGAHGPAWYNSIAGGASGAAEMRMPRNFWGYSSVEMIPWLNERPDEERDIFWHNATGMAVHHYRRAGWLRRELRSSGDWTYPYADWALYHHQHEKLPEELDLWWRYGTPLPIDGFFIESVQQIGVYGPSPSRESFQLKR